jgi:tRNA(Ile)-lysidine synthase
VIAARITDYVSAHRLISAADRIAVTVSGGADSVCLLHLLCELYPRQTCLVLHVNHLLRGPESDADEEFVRALADRLGVSCNVERVAVGDLPGNLEENARDTRMASFRRLVESGQATRVATGHTASDQAETVLFRLLRGTGTAGLCGIRPATDWGLIRPLLPVTRTEVRDWLRSRGLEWREDASNEDPSYARNRIRNHLIPQLEREFNPRLGFVMSNAADLAREDEDYWSAEIGRLAGELFERRDGAVLVRLGSFRNRPPAVSRRLVREALRSVRGSLVAIDFEHIDRVLQLLGKPEGHGIVQVPGAIVTRSFDWVRFAVRCPGSEPQPIRLKLEEISPQSGTMKGSGLAADKLPAGVECRAWKAGDRFRGRKLKHWFHDRRIPVWDRAGWPVMAIGSRVIWTREFGIDEEFAAAPGSRSQSVSER